MKNKTVILLMVFLLFGLTSCKSEQTGKQCISDQSASGSSAVVEDVVSSEASSVSYEMSEAESTQEEKTVLRITTTTFPVYDWVRNIVGNQSENVEIILINTEGEDFHSYRPDDEAMTAIAESNLFFCIGGKSEKWAYELEEEYLNKAEDSEENLQLPEMIFLIEKLNDYVIKPEADEDADADEQTKHFYSETVEGMEEHIWLSPANAYDLCSDILEVLKEADEESADLYEANAAQYLEILNDLDNAYLEAADTASCKILLIADRNPFLYLTDTYLLESHALFDECPQNDGVASAEVIQEMISLVKNNDYKKMIVDTDSQGDNYKFLTDLLKDRAIELIELRSMHGISLKEAEEGLSYISVMEENLENLHRILDF